MKLYYLNKGTHEYRKMKNSCKFPPCAFDQGNTIFEDSETQTIEVFETKEEALKYYSKEMKDNVDIENVTIKVYRVCENGKEDLLRECNMIAL